ncbi:MAG: glycosyltransferase family 4 protein [Planctomycetota bacterium]
MRILFVLHTYPPDAWGGTELHVRAIARHLREGHEVAVFCRGGDPLGAQDEVTRGTEDGIEVVRFNNLFEGYRSFQWTWCYPPARDAFARELARFAPDVVHVHHVTGLSATVVHAAKAAGHPVVFSLHDFWTVCPRGQRLHPDGDICETIDRARCHECLGRIWPDWFPRDGRSPNPENDLALYDREMARTLDLADILLTPSRFHRDRMLEAVPSLDPERIVALAHGLDHGMFPFPHDPAPRPRVVGYIGTVINTKGVHVLVEAMNRLDDPDLELRIHGDTPAFHENAEYVSLLRERARGAVRFMGHYDNEDLAELLRDVDILVVPSLWWETFSLTIREAMLAGVPVVASDIGAMKEAVETHGSGLLFRTGDSEDLARVLRRLIDDDELRRSCSGHRDRVKTIERNAADYLEIYERARLVAQQREDALKVNEPSSPQGGRRRRRKSHREYVETPLGPDPDDLGITIEKLGEGDVRVQSAVARGETTRVTFTFDYDAGAEPSEVRLVVDFKNKGATIVPASGALPEASRPSRSADSGAAAMVRADDEDWDREQRERAMYMMDDEIAADHSRKMDELVAGTTLDERDRDETPRASSRRRDEDEGGSRRRGRREEGDRPRRSERAPREERRDEAPRRERSERRSESPPEETPRRDERRRRTEDRAETSKPAEPRRPRGKKAESSDVVWGDEERTWALPEKSDESVAARDEKKRAPNHRLGRQPGLGGARDGSFGEGLGED